MLGKIFYNVIIFGSIISICIYPLLVFLSKNKYKYNFKSLYKIFIFILIILILPINIINFSNIKNISKEETKELEEIIFEEPEIKFANENTIIEIDDSINIKNDMFFNISRVLPYAWSTIALVLLGYNLMNYLIFLFNQKRHNISNQNINIDKIMEKLCSQMNIKNVSYRISDNVQTPMTIGIFNKKIILSKEILENKEYELILKHELFHIKNKDIEYKFLLLILNCVYWFNPIIYMFTNQIDEILELNCDEYVLQGKEQACRIEYAEILLNQIEKNRGKQYKFSMSFANRKENIMKRFSNIVDKSNKKSVISIGIVLIALLVISVSLMICIPNINFALVEDNNIDNSAKENTILLNEITEKRDEYLNSIDSENAVSESNKNTAVNSKENTAKEDAHINNNENVVKDETEIKLVANDKEKSNESENLELLNNEDKSNLSKNNELKENYTDENTNIVLSNPLKDVKYTLTSRFGNRNNGTHTGIDLAAPNGTNISACAPGVVIYSGYKGSYGNLVIINHGNEFQTYYAQCAELCVNEGETVSEGDIIAKVGSTGNSTGPHLHFEVREAGNAKNPQNYINF